jgi:hypothetical protein
MDLCRLIYVSKAANPNDPEAIKDIEATSVSRNQGLGVTGILLATRTQYLQVLEGDVQAVNQIYNNIVGDARHTNVTLIGYQRIADTQFKDWAMKGTSTGLMGRILAESLKKKYGEEAGDLKIPMDEFTAYALLLDVYAFLKEN